jgi:hypothetical protein
MRALELAKLNDASAADANTPILREWRPQSLAEHGFEESETFSTANVSRCLLRK